MVFEVKMALIQLHSAKLATALLIAGCAVVLVANARAESAAYTNRIPDNALAALEHGETFEILSLEPGTHWQSNVKFHGYKVLGQTTITNDQTRAELVAALKKGVEENKGASGNCFKPRHGIRVNYKGSPVDFVICFECLQVYVFSEGQERNKFLVTKSPEPVFNRVLIGAGILLAPKD